MNSALKIGIKKTVGAKAFRILCTVLFYALACAAVFPVLMDTKTYWECLCDGYGKMDRESYWMMSIIPLSAIIGLFIPDKRKSLMLLFAAGVLYVLMIFVLVIFH